MTKRILAILPLLCCLLAFNAAAQTKKDLKSEVERLQNANNVLTSQNGQLQTQIRQYATEIKQQQTTINRLRQDSAVMRMDYRMLSEEYVAFKQQAAATAANAPATGGGNPSYVDPSDTRPCAINQAKLQTGHTYTQKLGVLNSKGWGVQVYSGTSLCSAMEKAETFSKQYTMYQTYIKVKMVNGQKIFSVVYGSLKDYDQAKTYCKLFKEKARGPEKNAFLVQH